MGNNSWIFFMNGDAGSPYLLPSDPLLVNGFGLLAQIHSLVDTSITTSRHTSLALHEAFSCISKLAASYLFGFSARSAVNTARKFPDASNQTSCKISTQVNKDIASSGHALMEYYFNYKLAGGCSASVLLDKIFSSAMQHMCKDAGKLQKLPMLALAAAIVPPFNNMSPNVLAVPLEHASIQLHGSMDQCPCNVDNQGCAGLPLPELTWKQHAVEPRTGIEFPTVLDNILVGQDNPTSTSEVGVQTPNTISMYSLVLALWLETIRIGGPVMLRGSVGWCPKIWSGCLVDVQLSMKIIKIKSLKIYAFGFYIHPYSVCQRLGPKYASIQDNKLNEHPDFYADLLSLHGKKHFPGYVPLGVVVDALFHTIRNSAFEKSLRARLLKANPDTDYDCLRTFGSYFTQDIPLPVGTTIDFRRTVDGHLITEIEGRQIGVVHSKDLCRAFFDMYLGDIPVSLQTKEEIGKNVAEYALRLMGLFSLRPYILVLACIVLLYDEANFVNADFNYKEALTKSLIFLETQRSGKLPQNNRLPWRGDSGLQDGQVANVDLVGGYYDAGDNVKYGLPMAFTITTLSWAAIFYRPELEAAGELQNTLAAIRWGTDYFLKASSRKNRLYVQVGDPVKDHACWVRPENMEESERTVLKIDEHTPGTEIAAETAAAMAASSIAFRRVDRAYSRRLLNKAKLLFEFAKNHKGTYDGECPFYCSFSGYNDELLWAATWLYMATKRPIYLKYIQEEAIPADVSEFSWDLKYAGAQILLSKLYFEGVQGLENYKKGADSFVCSVLPASPYHQVYVSPGGMIHLRDGANTQYVTGTALLFSVYGDLLARHNQKITCASQQFDSSHLLAFAKQQIDYLLGNNPKGRSYMVGFGNNPPRQPHHRGASVPVLNALGLGASKVSCGLSFVNWYQKDVPNPNELTGAIVGGPDRLDNFVDKRWESAMLEPCTYINSLSVGALAKLAAPYLSNSHPH
ncbi:Glycoside hydrolase family 9 [Dillenia turbinata]|uniref:Endoglucanase n=1 Tax=Dillenia turbinata TaxID=194707 RepID=A0AAN8UCE6_9MAGN